MIRKLIITKVTMCVWSNVLESIQTMIALSAHTRALVKKRIESLAPPNRSIVCFLFVLLHRALERTGLELSAKSHVSVAKVESG